MSKRELFDLTSDEAQDQSVKRYRLAQAAENRAWDPTKDRVWRQYRDDIRRAHRQAVQNVCLNSSSCRPTYIYQYHHRRLLPATWQCREPRRNPDPQPLLGPWPACAPVCGFLHVAVDTARQLSS
jgi:hypothetical protein